MERRVKTQVPYVNCGPVEREVKFVDSEGNKVTVEIKVMDGVGSNEKLDWDTLEPVKDKRRLSICGNFGGCGGQIYDSIKVGTEGQKELVKLWREYHLNDMCSGTKTQHDFLRSKECQELKYKLVHLLTANGWREKLEEAIVKSNTIDTMPECNEFFHYRRWIAEGKDVERSEAHLKRVATTFLEGRGKNLYGSQLARFISEGDLGDLKDSLWNYASYYDKWTGELTIKDDYEMSKFLLGLKGLNLDRGYQYGHGWLMKELPASIESDIEALCVKLEEEEAERRKVLEKTLQEEFGDDDVEDFDFDGEMSDQDMYDRVEEVRDWDEDTIKRFIALGKALEESFVSLLEGFETEDEDAQQYSFGGSTYHVGTADELEEVCRDVINNDDEYEYFWRQAVEAKNTTLGLEDWKEAVVTEDGFAHTLDRYDGEGTRVKFLGVEYWICNNC